MTVSALNSLISSTSVTPVKRQPAVSATVRAKSSAEHNQQNRCHYWQASPKHQAARAVAAYETLARKELQEKKTETLARIDLYA